MANGRSTTHYQTRYNPGACDHSINSPKFSSSFERDVVLRSVSVTPLQHRSCSVCRSFVRLGQHNGYIGPQGGKQPLSYMKDVVVIVLQTAQIFRHLFDGQFGHASVRVWHSIVCSFASTSSTAKLLEISRPPNSSKWICWYHRQILCSTNVVA